MNQNLANMRVVESQESNSETTLIRLARNLEGGKRNLGNTSIYIRGDIIEDESVLLRSLTVFVH